jgi:N-acetylneuraminate synthase
MESSQVPPPELRIGERALGEHHPTYFIADIAANHDGDLSRAKELIRLAAKAGADAAKYQNFHAETIVSDHGFQSLGEQQSHQASWSKTPYQVYSDASLDLAWTAELADTCGQVGIAYLTSPYSLELVDGVDDYVPAYKIGSGDITWPQVIAHMASKGKPILLATGASTLAEVTRAVELLADFPVSVVLMQCNTNYTGDPDNIRFANLNVLRTFRTHFPGVVLGLSDHTPGHVTVLGAVALGARVIEKHFTDDTSRSGPDHAFAMTPATWQEMVQRTRELESALGDGIKRVEENELETVVLQRRALRTTREIAAGEILAAADMIPLRPCPPGSVQPGDAEAVVGRTTTRALAPGEALRPEDLE